LEKLVTEAMTPQGRREPKRRELNAVAGFGRLDGDAAEMSTDLHELSSRAPFLHIVESAREPLRAAGIRSRQ
jgi:hypothetical protein